mgnify:CR=1 FL=1
MTLEEILEYKLGCEKCNNKKDLHEHHIIPKIVGGHDKDGRFYLCKKCHEELTLKLAHTIISWFIKNCVFSDYKLRGRIKNYTEWWLKYG